MIWKKTWFSYGIWILFSAVAIGLFFTGAGKFCEKLGMADWIRAIGIPFLLCAALAGAMTALTKYLKGRTLKIAEKAQKPLSFVWEGLAIVLLLAAGIFIRMYFVPLENDNVFFEAAQIVKGQTLPSSAHGATYLYIVLLRAVFLLFGNKWMAGIVLQCMLQFGAGLLLYGAVRRAAGIFPSVCMLAAIMLFPGSVRMGMNYGTEMLFLCLYALGLMWVLRYLKGSQKKGVLPVLSAFFLGCYLGILTGLDLWAVSLFPLVISVSWLRKAEEAKNCGKRLFVQMPILLAGVILGFAGELFMYSLICGQTAGNAFLEWTKVYQNAGFVGLQLLSKMTAYGGYLFLGMLLIIVSFAFMISREKDALNGWLLVFLTMTVLVLFQVSSFSQTGYSMLIWLVPVLGGIGVTELFKAGQTVQSADIEQEASEAAYKKVLEETEFMREKKSKKLNEEVRPAYNPALFADANEHMEKPKPVYSHPLMEDDEARSGSYINVTSQPVPVRTQPIPEKVKVISEEHISMASIEEPLLFQPIGEPMLEQEEEPISATASESEPLPVPVPEAKPINYIENPLPVPKKHVKKTMDYDMEPAEDKMFFDYWVTNNDDFDI